jgi:hypothetical protein
MSIPPCSIRYYNLTAILKYVNNDQIRTSSKFPLASDIHHPQLRRPNKTHLPKSSIRSVSAFNHHCKNLLHSMLIFFIYQIVKVEYFKVKHHNCIEKYISVQLLLDIGRNLKSDSYLILGKCDIDFFKLHHRQVWNFEISITFIYAMENGQKLVKLCPEL